MTEAIQQLVRATDAAIARAYLKLFRERNALIAFLFHSLFRDEGQIAQNLVDPLQRTTVAQFRQFIEYYLQNGYRFVSPADVLNGLPPDGKYAMITFDDGYYNNVLARPLLEEFAVPATFFISTNHIRQNKCFWWDALYRERTSQGASHARIKAEALEMKGMTTERIEQTLIDRFGPDVLRPRGDIDRPFTPDELCDFATCPYVHLGNHTANHAILTNYSDDAVRQQVRECQAALREMTGATPVAIAYPNGAHDDAVVRACGEMGLKLGVTIRPHKAALPLDPAGDGFLRIGRFCPHGEGPMLTQCRTYRSDVLLYGLFRDGYLRLRRGQVAQ
ncbi:MAG TPA: polysaccharide deacetylase family protein [Tepidisphaeraceae bacterium]|jgi:peptidoglycan/xylan/chitin deacetylase (PgdA/CDA1 family)